ncbi:MAG: transporter [Bacteroidales bacterium]
MTLNKALSILILSFITLQYQVFGENLPPIQADRPDQTESPFITPAKYLQIEHGFTIENRAKNQKTFSYPSTLFKYGVNQLFELRLITDLITEKNNHNTSTGFIPLTFGFKAVLFEEKGILPKTSFLGHITSANIGSKAFRANHTAPSLKLSMQHTLSEKVSLAYNVGADWNGENASPAFLYTLSTGISLTEKLACYVELYGFVHSFNMPDHRCDFGLSYLINNNLITDISSGFGLTKYAPTNYISIGLSYRFKTTK